MGRTRSQPNKQTNNRVKKIRLSVWNGNLPQNISERLSKAESRGLLSSAAVVGRVEKSAKPGGLAPRLKQNPSLFAGIGVLKAHEKVAHSKAHLANFEAEKLIGSESESDKEEDVLKELHQESKQGVPAGGGSNLMGPVLAKGEVMILTGGGKFIQSPKIKMDLEDMASKMRLKAKWNCLTCVKFLQSEQAVAEHLKQAEITFVGRRQRMEFKPKTCQIKREQVFSEEDIQRKISSINDEP